MASLRDRFYTPRVARAIMAPSSILLAAAGTSVGLVAGIPVAAAVAVGVAAYGARVAVAVGAGRDRSRATGKGPRLEAEWERYVNVAAQARDRFRRAVWEARTGPLRSRLEEIELQLDQALEEMRRIAGQGQRLSWARRDVDADQIAEELDQLRQRTGQPSTALTRTAEALEAQLASARRLERATDNARDQLEMLDARIDEAVVRAIELSVAADEDELYLLHSDVDGLVGEMEAIRVGLEQLPSTG